MCKSLHTPKRAEITPACRHVALGAIPSKAILQAERAALKWTWDDKLRCGGRFFPIQYLQQHNGATAPSRTPPWLLSGFGCRGSTSFQWVRR